jgi:hypothetical protein
VKERIHELEQQMKSMNLKPEVQQKIKEKLEKARCQKNETSARALAISARSQRTMCSSSRCNACAGGEGLARRAAQEGHPHRL